MASLVRSYSFVVRGDSWLAICCACSVEGVKWQQWDSPGPEDRDDDSYEIEDSTWVQEKYVASDRWELGDRLRHYKLCFNAIGVLEVLASDIKVIDVGRHN